LRPKNIEKMIISAINHGFPAFHLIAYEPLIEAVRNVRKDYELKVIATIGLNSVYDELAKIDADLISIHASISDVGDHIDEILEKISDFAPAGIATHCPSQTLPKFENNDLCKFFLVPINKTLEFMGKNPQTVLKLVMATKKNVIAIKPLAAGKLKPNEAFPFVFKYADALTVGLTSVTEIEECYTFAKEFLS
jgi:hypothetical protein